MSGIFFLRRNHGSWSSSERSVVLRVGALSTGSPDGRESGASGAQRTVAGCRYLVDVSDLKIERAARRRTQRFASSAVLSRTFLAACGQPKKRVGFELSRARKSTIVQSVYGVRNSLHGNELRTRLSHVVAAGRSHAIQRQRATFIAAHRWLPTVRRRCASPCADTVHGHAKERVSPENSLHRIGEKLAAMNAGDSLSFFPAHVVSAEAIESRNRLAQTHFRSIASRARADFFCFFSKNCTCKDFGNDYDHGKLKFLVKEEFNAKDGNERRLVSVHGASVTRCREVRCLVSVASCLTHIGPSPHGGRAIACTLVRRTRGGQEESSQEGREEAGQEGGKKKVAKKAKKKVAKKKAAKK